MRLLWTNFCSIRNILRNISRQTRLHDYNNLLYYISYINVLLWSLKHPTKHFPFNFTFPDNILKVTLDIALFIYLFIYFFFFVNVVKLALSTKLFKSKWLIFYMIIQTLTNIPWKTSFSYNISEAIDNMAENLTKQSLCVP